MAAVLDIILSQATKDTILLAALFGMSVMGILTFLIFHLSSAIFYCGKLYGPPLSACL